MKKRKLAPTKVRPVETDYPDNRFKWVMTIIVMALAACLLFGNLGHYALWDDEAGLAVPARGVWQTGDTSIVMGHNIVAPQHGFLVRNLKDRVNAPFPALLMAPFAGFSGTEGFLPRVPLALCGLFCVGLLLRWLWRDKADRLTWCLMAMAILGNVSFFLYCRQARYYGITLSFSTFAAYVYLHWNGSRKQIFGLSLILLVILCSHYMTFASVVTVLAFDYFVWQRHVRKLQWVDWAILFAPLMTIGGLIVLTWNPLKSAGVMNLAAKNDFSAHLTLIWWNLRDLNRCEFGTGILMLLAPVVYLAKEKNTYLLRAFAAILIYCFTMAMVSPQTVSLTSVSDMRYLIALIPLCMGLGVLVVRILTRNAPAFVTLGVGLLAFETNLLNGAMFYPANSLLTTTQTMPFRYSTIASYVSELSNPPSDPYTVAAKWINENVKDGETIWVLPDYMTYPLIYHAPKAVYAWQLTPDNTDPQFANLPPIHFQGKVLPDYVITFGPQARNEATMVLKGLSWKFPDMNYEQVATLDFLWKDLYRPELFWRVFQPLTGFNTESQGIYVFKRKKN